MNNSRRKFINSFSSILGGSILFNDPSYFEFVKEIDFNTERINTKKLSKFYMIKEGGIYLNHASIGTIPQPVHNAHVKYLKICESNPSLYVWGAPWKKITDLARTLSAELLKCKKDDIAITHNTTEGFNILAHGLVLKETDEVLFSSLNHAGASMPWKGISKNKNFNVRSFNFPMDLVPEITEDRIVDLYSSQIRKNTKVLIFPHIDNIVGLQHPIEKIAINAKKLGVEYVFVDGAQSLGMIPLDLSKTKVDAYSMSPHKWLQAPKGTGLFFISETMRKKIPPMWYKSSLSMKDNTAKKYEDYSTRAWPAVVALADAIRFQNKIGLKKKNNYYNYLWSETKKIVDTSPDLIWHSPRDKGLSSMIMTIEAKKKSSFIVSKTLNEKHDIYLRPFENPLNALRISPNMFTSIMDIKKTIKIINS